MNHDIVTAPDRDDARDDDVGDDDDDDDDDVVDTGDPPDDDGPPDDTLDDCTPGTLATWSSGEIYVLSWDRETDSGVMHVQDTGWYHLYDTSLAESGSSQWNESSFIRITNDTFTDQEPRFGNCGAEWIVQDPDNHGALPENTRIYMGTFWMLAGDNTLTLHHYCPTYRAGQCTEFHITDDPNSTCDSGDANSVHFTGEGVCLVPAL